MPVLLKYFEDVQPYHLIADIGSGTGLFAERIFEARQLKNPICCVDPSPEMQEIAKLRKGVYAVMKTVEGFLDGLKADQFFHKMLCVGSFHHFSQPAEVLKGLRSHLLPGGELLVVGVDASTQLPLFTKAEEKNRNIIDSYSEECISPLLGEADFKVEVLKEKATWILKKSMWYEMLRGRFLSSLSQLSDEEIEEGIIEMEKGNFKNLKLHDDFEIPFTHIVFRATKPAAEKMPTSE